MKLKSFIAGAVGVFVFIAGQNLGAQANTFPAPDPKTGTLPAPDRDSSTLPGPDPSSALPPPATPSPPPQPQRNAGLLPQAPSAEPSAQAPVAASPAQAPDDSGRAPQRGRGGAATASPAAQAAGAPRSSRLPQTGSYLGAMAGLAFPDYNTDGTDLQNKSSFGHVEGTSGIDFGLFFGMDLGFLIGEAGALVSFDNADIFNYYNGYSTVEGVSIHIPLLVKLDLRLGPVVLQPLLGPYLNFALGSLHMDSGTDPYANPPFGFTVGGLAGLNLGRGLLFLDARYEADLGKTKAGNDPMTIWSRSAFRLNLGYQLYLGRRG